MNARTKRTWLPAIQRKLTVAESRVLELARASAAITADRWATVEDVIPELSRRGTADRATLLRLIDMGAMPSAGIETSFHTLRRRNTP